MPGQVPPYRLPPSRKPGSAPPPPPAEPLHEKPPPREPMSPAFALLLVLVWGLSAAIVAFCLGWLWARHGDVIRATVDAVVLGLGG